MKMDGEVEYQKLSLMLRRWPVTDSRAQSNNKPSALNTSIIPENTQG